MAWADSDSTVQESEDSKIGRQKVRQEKKEDKVGIEKKKVERDK